MLWGLREQMPEDLRGVNVNKWRGRPFNLAWQGALPRNMLRRCFEACCAASKHVASMLRCHATCFEATLSTPTIDPTILPE